MSSNVPSRTSCVMNSCPQRCGMGGRNLGRPCLSSWEVPWSRYSAGDAGIPKTSPVDTPMPPPAWRLPDKLQLPFPVATTNSPVRDMDWCLVPIPQLWPKDTFVKAPAAPIRAPLQLERACAAAVPPPSSARDSAASRSLCESTDTDRSDTTSQCSNTSSVELSQPTDQAASGVPPAPHAQSPVPPPAQTMATSPAAGDSRRSPVGPDLSTGHPGASASAPTSPQSCDGSIGPLDRNPATTRPQSPTSLPPPKRPVPGSAARANAASHHGYELTAPRRGIAYAHWTPLRLCEALPSPLSTVPSNTAGSPTPGSPVCGATAEGVDEHSVYVVAGCGGADGQPIVSPDTDETVRRLLKTCSK